MLKPSLQLIHRSRIDRPKTKRGRYGNGFRIIQGGATAKPLPTDPSWEAAFQVVDAGLLISCAFLQATSAMVDGSYDSLNGENPEKPR